VEERLVQRRQNALQNSIRLPEHLAVTESDHTKTCARQITRPVKIFDQVLRVLTAIEFNDQPRSDADEIHDIAP